ncbi:MAG: FHA domain-containing protein [Huintestinicola sp.]|uniref:FHA domain-containing protein n=1 Tax=Huintestinicola sp. TaxID=2981661 RepID=UPI003F068E3A
MNTVNLESISEATGNYLIYNAEPDHNFDRIAVKMLASDLPSFLAPVKIMNKFDRCVVKYDIGSYRSISSIKMRMSKKECCTLIYNMLYPMMTCSEWLLDYHKFCFQKEHILCDANTFEVRYIYILEKSFCASDDDIMDTIRSIFRNTDIIDDKDFRIDLLQALLDDNFSVNSLYEMIMDIRKEQNASGASKTASSDNSRLKANPLRQAAETRSASAPHEPVFENVGKPKAAVSEAAPAPSNSSSAIVLGDDDDDEMANLFSSSRKSPKAPKPPKDKNKPRSDIFGSLFGKNKPAKTAAAAPANESEDDHTVIMGMASDGADETQIFGAYLILESTELSNCPPSIPLDIRDGDTVTIGRKSANSANANADIEFPSDCIKISRRHCRIRLENGIYSICDLNSGNGTFVDGQKAEPGVWADVRSGSKIMFGNNVAVYSLQINA